MAKMIAFFVLGVVLAGSFQHASGARQLQQILPALAGTPTWAPAASYSSMHITAPLPLATPTLGPRGIAMPDLTPPLGVLSSASNMRLAGAPAPVISLPPGITAAAAAPRRITPEHELERPRFVDNTKMVVADTGITVAGTGLAAPAGASNTLPKPTTPSVQTAPGAAMTPTVSRTSGASYSQALPAIPNIPVNPPTLIFDGMVQMPAQTYQWAAPQQQQAHGQTLGQLTQKTAQLVQQQLANPGEQLQKLAAAASEGNLARFIEDAGKIVSKNIQNVTAAANSIIAATNNIIESLPKNLTVPGELSKLINTTTLQLPRLSTLNPIQVPSMARLAAAAALPGGPQLPQLPSLSSFLQGVQSLQLPRIPGLGSPTFNPAATVGSAAAQNAAAAASVQMPSYYAQDFFGVAALNANGQGNARYQASASGSPNFVVGAAVPAPMSDVERRARAAAQKAQEAVAEATGATLPARNAATMPAAGSTDAATPAHDTAAAARRTAARAAQQQQQARSARANEALQAGAGFRVVDGEVVPAAQ